MSKKFTLRKKIMSCISALAFLGTANLSSNISWAMEQPPAQPLPCNDINTYKNFLNQKLGGNHNVMYTTNNNGGLTNDAPIIANAASDLYPDSGGPLNNREDLKESLHTLPCGAIITKNGMPFLVDQSDVGNPKCSRTVGDILVPGFDGQQNPFLLVRAANFTLNSQNYEWLPLTISPLPRLTQNFPGCYVDQQGKAFASNGNKLVWNEDSSDILEGDGNGDQVEIKYPELFGITVKTPPPAGNQQNQPPKKEQPVDKKEEKKEENANKWPTWKKATLGAGIGVGVLSIGGGIAYTVYSKGNKQTTGKMSGGVNISQREIDWKSSPAVNEGNAGKENENAFPNRSPRAKKINRNLQRRVRGQKNRDNGQRNKSGNNGKTLVSMSRVRAKRGTH